MRGVRWGLFAVALTAIALVLVSGAVADNVTHDAEVTLAPGDAAPVSITITATDDDSDGTAECDPSASPATVSVSDSGPITATPSTLEFQACETKSVSLSAATTAAAGDYTVTVAVSAGPYSVSPGSITVHVVTPPDTTPPTLTLPGPLSAEATSPAGAAVAYTASANDNVDGTVGVTCSAGSGATFPKGQTTVGCSATDSSKNTAHGSFTVTVVDTQPPALALPSPGVVEATSGSGAVVTFSATATDAGDGVIDASCNPPSGATFPKGQTTVTCSAQDSSGNMSLPGTFTVTVQDTQPPTLSLSSPAPVEATSSTGATVAFGASATDTVDGNRQVNCIPASGSTFPIGSTTVNCTAGDTSGNNVSGTLTVTVTDAGPSVTMPPTQKAEANGPTGARVNYAPAPLGSDVVDGPLPVTCSKASGSVFPLGQTTVTCTATDSKGSSATGSFQVNVVDTTPPIVTAPAAATFVAEGSSLSRSFPALAAYLARGRAADLVDPNPTLYVDAPLFLPLGPTVVIYTAVDGAGNRDSATTTITIVPPPPPGQRAPTPPPDDPPPANVTALRATPGNALVRLAWTAPRDDDVVRYAAFRSERTGPVVQVYSGAARSFVDRGLVNGVEYRYIVVAYDRGGNRSVGVAVLATPRLPMLLAPRDGARLAKGTMFSWRRVAGARYYNFQLFRVGDAGRVVKILSVWPVTNSFRLRATWRFERRAYRLTPGTYRWFVWPGFGARADSRYGELLGQRSFTITRQRG